MDGLAEWNVAETGSIQVIADADRAGTALLTFAVDDLDDHLAALADSGLTPGARTASERSRTATVTDPEGNAITFAEVLGTDD